MTSASRLTSSGHVPWSVFTWQIACVPANPEHKEKCAKMGTLQAPRCRQIAGKYAIAMPVKSPTVWAPLATEPTIEVMHKTNHTIMIMTVEGCR